MLTRVQFTFWHHLPLFWFCTEKISAEEALVPKACTQLYAIQHTCMRFGTVPSHRAYFSCDGNNSRTCYGIVGGTTQIPTTCRVHEREGRWAAWTTEKRSQFNKGPWKCPVSRAETSPPGVCRWARLYHEEKEEPKTPIGEACSGSFSRVFVLRMGVHRTMLLWSVGLP